MRKFMRTAGVCCAGVILASTAAASEIYKCVSSDGLTYYTESAPKDRDCERLKLKPLETVDSAAPDRSYRSALDVAKDIEASRLERERVRLERERLRLEREKAASETPRGYTQERSYYPLYPRYSGKQVRPHQFRHDKKRLPRRGWGDEYWPHGGRSGSWAPARAPGFGGR